MHIERRTSFRTLGTRTYVHSTQLFSEFLDLAVALPEVHAVTAVKLYKFVRETSKNGHCLIAPAGEIDVSKAAGTIAFAVAGWGDLQFAFFDDGYPAEGGGPDLAPRISSVEHTADFSGIVRLRNSGAPGQLFVDLIEANKALHNATLLNEPDRSPPAYRFVYAENLLASGAPGRDIELIFKAREARQRGGHTYTLGEVTVSDTPQLQPIRICFAF